MMSNDEIRATVREFPAWKYYGWRFGLGRNASVPCFGLHRVLEVALQTASVGALLTCGRFFPASCSGEVELQLGIDGSYPAVRKACTWIDQQIALVEAYYGRTRTVMAIEPLPATWKRDGNWCVREIWLSTFEGAIGVMAEILEAAKSSGVEPLATLSPGALLGPRVTVKAPVGTGLESFVEEVEALAARLEQASLERFIHKRPAR